jgi:hypothetical protein
MEHTNAQADGDMYSTIGWVDIVSNTQDSEGKRSNNTASVSR